MSALWPVYEFRPLPRYSRNTVSRYADGQWVPDDGEWDLAFMIIGPDGPLVLGVDLPYQKNIIWKGLTSHWSAQNVDHPRCNPWHYMLRDGETEWGGPWSRERDAHPNSRAYEAGMRRCCSLRGSASGTGPKFDVRDPYILAELLRERESREIVVPPARPVCMYCGEAWADKLARGEQP